MVYDAKYAYSNAAVVLPCLCGPSGSKGPKNRTVVDDATGSSAMAVRIERVLAVAKLHGQQVLVLGAFGCGVFKNNPAEVAAMFRSALDSKAFRGVFRRVIFAILVRSSTAQDQNLDAFAVWCSLTSILLYYYGCMVWRAVSG